MALKPSTWALKFPLWGGIVGAVLSAGLIFMLGTEGVTVRLVLMRLAYGFVGGFVIVLLGLVFARAWKY